MNRNAASLLAFPMHGFHKWLQEGFRTRDAHLCEWFAKLLPPDHGVAVVSRPEPFPRRERARWRASRNSGDPRLMDVGRSVVALPNLRDRQRWWVDSLRFYRARGLDTSRPWVIWNPFAAQLVGRQGRRPERIVLDLLDDWTSHRAFRGVHAEVVAAYRAAFDSADVVFANSEGTVELANRFGRSDVELLPNGCDPERFTQSSAASGRVTVGYVGKIGSRLDLELIRDTVEKNPDVRFLFAGPCLERGWRRALSRLGENVQLLGDVHYSRVPDLLARFDIGWIPHRVGVGEVGGDAIKLYEYRAAGLPVISTPIIGVKNRPLSHVTVVDSSKHSEALREIVRSQSRVPRAAENLPRELTWAFKAERMLLALGVAGTGIDR